MDRFREAPWLPWDLWVQTDLSDLVFPWALSDLSLEGLSTPSDQWVLFPEDPWSQSIPSDQWSPWVQSDRWYLWGPCQEAPSHLSVLLIP